MSEDTPAAPTGAGSQPRRMLSKSDFKLARTCGAKLFFRENRFPDNRASNPYLVLLAEGGYMVEALAKAKYPNGIRPEHHPDPQAAGALTLEYLQRDEVVLFEATLVAGRQQARADILVKTGNVVRLLEVKSKSFDGMKHATMLAAGKAGALCGVKAPFPLLSDWVEKVEDVAFQVVLLERMLPGVIVQPYLVLVDTSKTAAIDNIPSLFAIERRASADGTAHIDTATYLGSPDQLAGLDLITEVDVAAQVAQLRDDVTAAAAAFESLIDAPLQSYATPGMRDAKCARCEFRGDVTAGRSGFAECWGALATPSPHLLELFSVGRAKAPDKTPLVPWMIGQGKASLLEIPEEGLVNADGKVGPIPLRQRRQIEYTRRNEVFIGPALRSKVESLHTPLHFIDFETSRLALPYHRGMRPYGLVTFQWSCHTAEAVGETPRHTEWLNDAESWPNQLFAEALRKTIGDEGTILTWSPFEETTLKQVLDDLRRFGRHDPELAEWVEDVFERRAKDLHEWARDDYFHPGMRGRTSIKVVLDALWKSDEAMRQQFERWTGRRMGASEDPYASLPPIEISGIAQEVHEGTGAMRAYQEMMYGATRDDSLARARWAALLKQYCALDTLSMVLILEHWRRATA